MKTCFIFVCLFFQEHSHFLQHCKIFHHFLGISLFKTHKLSSKQPNSNSYSKGYSPLFLQLNNAILAYFEVISAISYQFGL